MRDYNFFSEYVFAQSSFKFRKLILPILFFVVIAAVVVAYIFLELRIGDKQETLDAQIELLESKEVRETLQAVESLREEIAVLTILYEETGIFDLQIQEEFSVTEFLTQAIVISLPRNVAFLDYSIDQNSVIVSGFATAYADIAEFENNLRDLNVFFNIFVGSIEYDEDMDLYTFTLSIVLGGEEK
ncbi:MAG: PilN domain-containing protein [Clostridiales bacterium]|nr:PilN domain-containing protein [Clostridiales bacterium]